jgi:hypothetical protein
LGYPPTPFNQKIFFVLSLVANFCKLVVLYGGKLESNEISKNKFEGVILLKNKKIRE